MEKNQRGIALLPVIIILAVLIGGGFYVASRGDDEVMMQKEGDEMMEGSEKDMMADKEATEAMMKKDEMMKGDESVMEKKEGAMMAKDAMYKGEMLAGTKAPLLDFVKADYDNALVSGKLVVLYFYADWCPLCRAEFPKMQSAFNSLTTDDVIGFRVNFKDSFTDADETALAKQFGVAYQHTKVFVKGGVQVLKSPESWNEARYLSEIKKVL